ncbi:TIGR03761 family integrating conjugative element protein [Pasteurella skyensis]|uniref:PFL_4669 family integrating conjugative element protein n=1 Tax=Phocoenobacter skyensis TaxID=97481 RepID=UPI002760A1DA|nr:TIGR03761 family integrating conjugative element protein [Pasteurella skyensis]MDP8189095.1 TIGR03761 family integrating conjugative element protein [Pasteurella skyensis]
MTQEHEQELGVLRSVMTFTIHSQYAAKIWNGRPIVREGKEIIKAQILSMPNCLALLSQIQKDAANDDPYADWYLLQFEEKVLKHSEEMKKYINQIVDIYADRVPENMDIQGALNINPITYPIYANSQLGYKLIYLLADFDMLARSVQTASHIALMTRRQAQEWLEAGAKLIRQCFGVVENYRHSGITRQDVIENNERYKESIKRFRLTLPESILTGERRAEFAPTIRNQANVAEIDEFENGAVTQERGKYEPNL